MKIKIISLIILNLLISKSFSQLKPESFYLSEDKLLYKVSAENPASNSISDILTVGDTVWLGTSRGVSVSFDRGLNWTNFYNTGPFGEDGISAIGYYKGTFWAATVTTVEGTGGESIAKGTGLKYTNDNGVNWTAVPQPVDGPNDSIEVYGINTLRTIPITVAEQNVTYDIAFTPGNIWITSFAGGLRRSQDNGQTWQRVILPTDSLNSISPTDTLDGLNLCISPIDGNFCGEGWLNYRAFSVIDVNDTTLYVGTANGINKTENANSQYPSWVKFTHQNQDNPISGNFIVALGHSPTQIDDEIWAATWRAEDNTEFYGVSLTTDGGENWNTFLEDERAHNFGFKNVDVIAATDNGAFRTRNKGNSWILPNNIVDKKSGVALTTTEFFSSASEGEDLWLGSNDGLAKLAETTFWEGEWKVYFASLALESGSETYCYPNPFSPRLEELKIKYTTNAENKKVTIRVFDFGMNIVRTVIQNADRTKTLDDAPEKWDGRDEKGNIVPNGVYFYSVEAGDDEPVFGKVIVLQ